MDRMIQKKRIEGIWKINHFRGMFRAERKRIFSIQYVFVTALLLSLILGADTLNNMANLKLVTLDSASISFYQLYCEMIWNNGFFLLLFIPASLFVVLNLCQDIQEKMVYFYASRSNISAYIIVKIIIGISFTFLVSFIVLDIYVVISSGIMSVVRPGWSFDAFDGEVYRDLLFENPVLYFVLRNFYISLTMALFTGVGMVITVFIPNIYVAILSPLLSFFITDKLIALMNPTTIFSFSNIMNGNERNSETLWRAITSEFLFFLFCYCIISVIFYKGMKWRCYGERT